ncbi:alkaline phosphatase, partial [Arthrospira platensis SPKY1]|nr:alkaline phosphatase [Arthrospira platensis SPKY1]
GTAIALETLSKNEQGFFLMVEGSQIDWAGHANDSAYLVTEMFDFDEAVKTAFDFADQHPETLVIVTADHETGGLTLIRESKGTPLKLHYSSGDHSAVMVPVFA